MRFVGWECWLRGGGERVIDAVMNCSFLSCVIANGEPEGDPSATTTRYEDQKSPEREVW